MVSASVAPLESNFTAPPESSSVTPSDSTPSVAVAPPPVYFLSHCAPSQAYSLSAPPAYPVYSLSCCAPPQSTLSVAAATAAAVPPLKPVVTTTWSMLSAISWTGLPNLLQSQCSGLASTQGKHSFSAMSKLDSASDPSIMSYHSSSTSTSLSSKRGHIIHGRASAPRSHGSRDSAPSSQISSSVGQPTGPPNIPLGLTPSMALYGMQGSLNNLTTILSHSMTGQRELVAVASEMVSEVDKELLMNV